MVTNTDTAKRLAQVADALAQYAHLPLVELAAVGMHGTVMFSAAYTDRTTRARIVAAWAQEFGVPVVLDANQNEIRAHVPLVDDVRAEVSANIGNGMVYALRAALGLSLEFDAGPTEVPVEQLLAVLTTPTAPDEPTSVAGDLADATPVDAPPAVAHG